MNSRTRINADVADPTRINEVTVDQNTSLEYRRLLVLLDSVQALLEYDIERRLSGLPGRLPDVMVRHSRGGAPNVVGVNDGSYDNRITIVMHVALPDGED